MKTGYRKQGERLYFDVSRLEDAEKMLRQMVSPLDERKARYIEAVAPDGSAKVLKDLFGETPRVLGKTTEER